MVYQESLHPSNYSSNVMSKRNMTSQKNRINNRLIYRRNKQSKQSYQRRNIDINDRFFIQRSEVLKNQVDHMQNNPLFQGQGSQRKTQNQPKEGFFQKRTQKYIGQNAIDNRTFFNIPGSPSGADSIIVRPINTSNKRFMGLHPSPYQNKNMNVG
jgi:hypothetical protein